MHKTILINLKINGSWGRSWEDGVKPLSQFLSNTDMLMRLRIVRQFDNVCIKNQIMISGTSNLFCFINKTVLKKFNFS